MTPLALGAGRQAEYRDAFVEGDHTSGRWTIGNDAVRYTLHVNRDRTLTLAGLTPSDSSEPVTLGSAPDTVVAVDGDVFQPGERNSTFRVDTVDASEGSHFVSLSVRLRSVELGLAATRHYVVYAGAAAVEMWTTLESLDGEPHAVRDLNAYAVTVPAGEIEYVTGMRPLAAGDAAFTRRTVVPADGERITLGSMTLSSEHTVPYFSVGDGRRRVVSGLLWSGGWAARLVRDGQTLDVSMGLPHMSAVVRPDRPVESPHVFLGVVPDVPGAAIAQVSRFVREGRGGRPFPAWTTFNTWFLHGINIDENVVRRDIDYAAEMGLELFQLDAGWYPRPRPEHAFDFTEGLGSWQVDTERFPSGLASLAAYARRRGMKFGVWVEPERVALGTVGRPGGASVSYLAQQDGAYAPGTPNETAKDAQICLAYPPARAWVQEKLFALLDTVRPDNLKWDVNRWVHCTRTDHGHPVDGGAYEHTRGLYALLAEIRARYPALTIENCSGGGHRIDFALARLTDTAWMDDRTAPAGHVRRNLKGLLHAFPSPYLFSYVLPHGDEPLRGAVDLPLLVRSRMPGVVGLTAALGELEEGERNVLQQEFALAKRLRPLQQGAVTHVLTPQRAGPGDWDVIQQVGEDGTSLLFAYTYGAGRAARVYPRGLRAEVTYELRSADRGVLARLRGEDLMAHGLEIHPAPESGAQVLVLEAR